MSKQAWPRLSPSRLIDYSKKSLGPVTKHISDSFKLLSNLSDYCPLDRGLLQFFAVAFRFRPFLSGTTPIIEFSGTFARVFLQKKSHFFLIFAKNGNATTLSQGVPREFTNYSQLF